MTTLARTQDNPPDPAAQARAVTSHLRSLAALCALKQGYVPVPVSRALSQAEAGLAEVTARSEHMILQASRP